MPDPAPLLISEYESQSMPGLARALPLFSSSKIYLQTRRKGRDKGFVRLMPLLAGTRATLMTSKL